ncbi:Txe/YoeB family addiction module toxin [Solimonas variicoloris]|uniref:Txe/YoeB family addiction module toxin n=1 Tax=Solimonas variicoloris TaxID=254408 RepID=UPI000376E6B0|nr:Txe/YoeB family addiction module toxin [Solimonas variicoloris]
MPERLVWTPAAWSDYVWWQSQDRKTLRRINLLLQDAMREPFAGLGKPEALRENLSGFWSRRIDDTNRLVYAVEGNELVVIACRYHYD